MNVTEEVLAELFAIGLEQAKNTLRATLQRATQLALLPISHRYRADWQLSTKQLNQKFASDSVQIWDISVEIYHQGIPAVNFISLKDKDIEFIQEFRGTINNKAIKDAK